MSPSLYRDYLLMQSSDNLYDIESSLVNYISSNSQFNLNKLFSIVLISYTHNIYIEIVKSTFDTNSGNFINTLSPGSA